MTNSSIIPSALIGASHLGRYVFRPDGPKGIAFTLSMYDTAIPTGDGGTWVGYRLYQRAPDGDRKGTVIFEARTCPPTPTKDPADLAKLILDNLAVGPGDISPDPTESYTPEQLEWATKWGAKLRKTASEKFGWQEHDLKKLRADLDIVYHRREDAKAHNRHQLKTGVISVSARTKREAVAELRGAVANHIASIPQFRAGDNSGQVYCLYPHGAEQVIQVLRPKHPDALLGDAMRFRTKDLEEARRTFEVITKGLEAPADAKTKFVPVITEQTITAPVTPGPTFSGNAKPGKPEGMGLPGRFDHPIPKSRVRGLPGGILQSP